MEPEGSLPHSQVPATSPYPEPHRSSPCPPNPLPEDPSKYYRPIYTWVKWSLTLRFPDQNPVYTSPPTHTCYIPRPSHSSRVDQPNNLNYVVYFTPLLPRPSKAQIFSSTPHSQTPST